MRAFQRSTNRNCPRASWARVLIGLALGLVMSSWAAAAEVAVEDIFGRRINEAGIVLVDWEGQIANPAIKILLRPPAGATFPAEAEISGTEPRLYFDLPSEATGDGPRKTITFPDAQPRAMYVSIFPDRDGRDEEHALTIRFSGGDVSCTQSLNVRVVDQDRPERGTDFEISVDFTKDRTGFFSEWQRWAIVQQAADDWAYFFADMNLKEVAAEAERTFIWGEDGFLRGSTVRNVDAYRGFRLYAYGVDQSRPPFRSGGEASVFGGFQMSADGTLPLRRSGGVEVETKGNYNTRGWRVNANDRDWWQADNLRESVPDFASVMHHEIGHALIFHPQHTRFGDFKHAGAVADSALASYLGRPPAIDPSDHLNGQVDRASGKGAFGYEYYGFMPARRWLITKTDLLVAQAIGYTLRETSAFTPLEIVSRSVPAGSVGESYAQSVEARGGIPFYKWAVKSGALPPGLALDSFTGAITGRPTAAGAYAFVVEVAQYDVEAAPVAREFAMTIAPAASVIAAGQ